MEPGDVLLIRLGRLGWWRETLHNVLPYLGLSIGEFCDLDALGADCAAEGDWTCMATTAPMQLPAGVATPANAVAIR